MSMSIKKRLALGAGALASVGAVATLVAGVTFGLFSATPVSSSANTFATGTVSTTSGPTSTVCQVTNMVPGDESAKYAGITNDGSASNNQGTKDATCEFQVQYTGSVPAYIGLGTSITGNLPLNWEITSAESAYTATTPTEASQPGAYTTNTQTSAVPPTVLTTSVPNTNTAGDPLYVAADTGNATAAHGNLYTFWVDYQLPTSYTAQTNTGSSLTLTVYAVQSGNNAQTCTQGTQCSGTPAWS